MVVLLLTSVNDINIHIFGLSIQSSLAILVHLIHSLNTCWMVYTISVGLGGALRSVLQYIMTIFVTFVTKFHLYSNLKHQKKTEVLKELYFPLSFWVYTVDQQPSFHIMLYCSTRVSNELGAKHPQHARLAVWVVIIISISEGVVVGTATILVRHVWGKLYSNEAEVIRYVAKMMPLLALSNFLDGFQCVLSGSDFLL